MSIEAMVWALEVPVAGNAKVVLLGLANHAHPDGTEAYPSLDTLGHYARCDKSTARRNLRKLEEDGWISRHGFGPQGQTKWRLILGRGEDGILQPLDRRGGCNRGGIGGGIAMPPEPKTVNLGEVSPTPPLSERLSTEDVRGIFEYWQERCNRPAARFTLERGRKIRQRLAEGYTVEQVQTAIDGAAKAAYVNDQGKRFDDLELICRNGSKLEDFIGRATQSVVVPIGHKPSASDLIRKIKANQEAS